MNKQSGMALISVLLISTVIVSILAGIYYRQSLAQDRVYTGLMLDKATLIGLSTEEWVRDLLIRDALRSTRDSLDEDWAQVLPPFPVEGGVLQGRLQDLQARVNLNRFTHYTAAMYQQAQDSERSDYQLLKRLATACGAPLNQAQLSALVDWQDPDEEVLPAGAESAEYQLLTPPYRTANGPLVSRHELLLVQGFDEHTVAGLAPCISLLPADGMAINVNTASAPVLMALTEQLDADAAQGLINAREQAPWNTEQEFYGALAETLGLEDYKAARTLVYGRGFNPVAISSSYFRLEMMLNFDGVRFQLSSILHRTKHDNRYQVRTISRTIRIADETTENEA